MHAGLYILLNPYALGVGTRQYDTHYIVEVIYP